MQASELLSEAYTIYRGKGALKTPVWGSEKANTALSIANRKTREWATDSNNRWDSLFEIRSVDTVAVATPTYLLDPDFFAPSDFAQVVRLDGSIAEYSIAQPQKRNLTSQCLYISGRNPKTITFANTIDTGLDGGNLKIAAYFVPPALVLATDVVSVDDQNWLAYSVAAELARNDPAKDDQFPTLLGMANDLYRKMVDRNNSVGFLQGNSVTNNMPSIGSSTEDWSI